MKTAVVCVNLGTPSAPTASAVRRFLREFLSDRRVVEIPRLLWLPLLYAVILPLRSRRVAKKYRELWMKGESPLRYFSRALVDGVQQRLDRRLQAESPRLHLAMTYGEPGLNSVLAGLSDQPLDRLLIVPLYPQYSATTTAAVHDRLLAAFAGMRDIPQWHWIKDYHDHPLYIEALANSVREHWAIHGRGEKLLMSFHGIPKRNIDLGDPYQRQCETTARLLAEALQLDSAQWQLAFQSRFGKAEWLQPYTADTVCDWGRQGIRKIDVICPAFATECLETLEEIDREIAQLFLENGGEALRYIPCLNDGHAHQQLLETLIVQHLSR